METTALAGRLQPHKFRITTICLFYSGALYLGCTLVARPLFISHHLRSRGIDFLHRRTLQARARYRSALTTFINPGFGCLSRQHERATGVGGGRAESGEPVRRRPGGFSHPLIGALRHLPNVPGFAHPTDESYLHHSIRLFLSDSLPADRYQVPALPATGEFRDRGSKFVAHLEPVRTEAEALATVEEQRRAHPKCNHHCYAYRLGPGTDRWRTNDDGEPSGTAGKPILGQIDKAGLSDVVIVVSRYFGGTKLGTSGLINAYREAARLAVLQTTFTTRVLTKDILLRFGYELMTPVMSALSQLALPMADQQFGTRAEVRLTLPRSTAPATLRLLLAAIAGVYPEEVDENYSIPGLAVLFP